MRKSVSAMFIGFLLLIAVCFSSVVDTAAQQGSVSAVSSVDLKRYSGKWFEIARLPNKFQKDCVGNVTADYALNSDGSVQVTNRCLKKDGKVDEAIGKAKVEDKQTNSKLEVRFAPSYLSFLPAVWGDYWVIDLEPNYQYAVVGNPDRKYLWILSRKPEMDDGTYQQILRRVEKMGYAPNKLMKTAQNMGTLKGAVVGKQ